MKIGIIGASGKSGGFLTREALRQGHEVTAMVRDRNKILDHSIAVMELDIFSITPDNIKGLSAAIDAFRAPEGKEEQHLTSMEHLISVFESRPEVRLMVVGGAGSLFTDADKKTMLMNSPGFPSAYLPTATNMGQAFERLKASKVNWTYLSPAAEYDPDGKRTGSYALGGDVMIFNREGKSYVSYADYAIAMIDEVKNKAYANRRFSVVAEKA